MKKFIFVIIGIIAFLTIISLKAWNSNSTSLSLNEFVESHDDTSNAGLPEKLWLDIIMYAKGHSFGYRGDVSMWGGWYFDMIYVGDDRMLSYDSIGSETLKLSPITKNLVVNLGDPAASAKIRDFMQPIDGFTRFQKTYEECLDSVVYEDDEVWKYMGDFTFTVDYPDSCVENREKNNRFICDLTGIPENEKAKIPGLPAFYAGFKPTKYYRAIYSGNSNDIKALSNFLAHKIFENWIRGGELDIGSSGAALTIKPHIANTNFVTFGKYEYEREGTGHGMYTETFHTLDLKSGRELRNRDIFKSNSFDKVKSKLFEAMTKDPHYLAWHEGLEDPNEIEEMIEGWQSPSPILEGTEWEEPKRDFKFELPDGALTDSGVVFSFQPYEIDCWAAGAYHFIVPYKELMPYMTSETKRLISVCKSK